MAEAGLIGHITGKDDKKRKEGDAQPLLLPFTSPSHHLLIGGADSRHEEVLGATITNALLAGNNVVAFDTTGMIVPFLMPFLPGDHVKKVRGLKERIPQDLVANMRPAGVFFNSSVEETTGSAMKGWFSLPKILLDAAKLTIPQQESLRNTFGISKSVLMKDVLQSVVAVAFGKDYIKVKERAAAFVDYLQVGFELLADQGLPYPTWVHARDALFKGNLSIQKPPSLSDADVDVFGRTLDFYLTNAILFKPPRLGPAIMDLESLAHTNFFLFYLQDMNEREQALTIVLLVAQHVIASVTKPGRPDDPISVAMRHNQTVLAFDELGTIMAKGHPVLQPMASTITLLREATLHGCSLLMSTRAPIAVDLELLETDVLGPSIAGSIETNIYIGKVKEKEGLTNLVSWLGNKGARVSSASIEGLKPSQALLVTMKAESEAVRFEMLESGVMSIAVTPALLKSMLATPILVSKKPAANPAPGSESKSIIGAAAHLKAVPEAIPDGSESTSPIEPRLPLSQMSPVEPKIIPAFAEPPQASTPPTIQKPQILTSPRQVEDQVKASIEMKVPPPPESKVVDTPAAASTKPNDVEVGFPVVEELLDQYEPVEADSDEGIAGERGDEQGNMSSDIDFLSRLLGAEQTSSPKGKLSRMDYNMALNALLFKLEKVVKASFGVQFFKELMSSKSMPYDRAMEMYYEETNAMLKGKFAVQQGGSIVYQGIKEAVRAIVGELGLQIPVPADEDLRQLETEFLKALDMPRQELLQRIKDGSLYF